MRQLETQNDELLRRLEHLERGQRESLVRGETPHRPGSGRVAEPEPAPDVPDKEMADAEVESADGALGITARYGSVRAAFHAFGDAGFEYRSSPEAQTSETTFALGTLDLFTTAHVANRFRTVAEIALEGGSENNEPHIELERLWGAWAFNDALTLKFGREHSPTSRWNRLFHHGKWFWLPATQPFLARFEDDGGPLPLHFIGLEANGRLQTIGGVLEYVGVISNGRGRKSTEVTTFGDSNEAKAITLALGYTPYRFSGLSTGASFYADEIPSLPGDPMRRHSIGELIESVYLQYTGQRLDLLGEFTWIAHRDRTADRSFDHRTGYLQLGYRIGSFIPYLRFDYREMGRGDPFYAPDDVDLDAWEQILGVRYDLTDTVALKLEGGGGREEHRNPAGSVSRGSFERFAAQLTWMF